MKDELLQKYDKPLTLCFTGHRPERLPRDSELLRMQSRLYDVIEEAVNRGYVNFVSGAMSGFDTLAAEQVLLLKEKYPFIQCVLVAPFSVRFFNNKNWTPEWEGRLRAVVKRADFGISLSEYSYKGVYYERDRVIVDMSSEVIAYYDGGSGGTKYTIDYALAQNKPVCNIAKYKDHAFLPDNIACQVGARLLASMEDVYERLVYRQIRGEFVSAPHIPWGKNIHVLIISDRCGGRAVGLYEYLTAKTDLTTVCIADSPLAIQTAMQQGIPDIFIFVGYQEDKRNYQILDAMRNNRQKVVAMYAHLDYVIRTECETFGIPLIYHSMNPLADFVGILRQHLPV